MAASREQLPSGPASPALRPHAQAHLLSKIDKCKVCSEPAAKHIHYGAMSCFSCRAFFRRSIQNNTAGTYQCRRAHACPISLKTRRNCQWCRYQCCIAVGMKPSWVLSSEERERRFRKNRDKKTKRPGPAGAASPPPLTPSPPALARPPSPQDAHQLVTVKMEAGDVGPFPGPTVAIAPHFATIQMISGGLQLAAPRPLLAHGGVIVRQYARPPVPAMAVVVGRAPPAPAPPPSPRPGPPPRVADRDESEGEDSQSSQSSDEDSRGAVILAEPEIKFTEGEMCKLQLLMEQHNVQYKSVNFGESLIKEMIMCSMFGIPVSMSAAISGYRLTVERINRVANNNECFGRLPKTHQDAILKENADLLVSMRGAIFFDSRKKGVSQVLISMGIDDMDTIKTMFTPLMKEDRMKHIDYKTFNSIQQVNNSETELRYNFLQGKVAEAIGDEIITTLLTYIILFSVDFCLVADRRRIECVQERYIKMLERYIYSKHGRAQACHQFTTCLNAVTCIREMADIKKRRQMNMSRQAVKIDG